MHENGSTSGFNWDINRALERGIPDSMVAAVNSTRRIALICDGNFSMPIKYNNTKLII